MSRPVLESPKVVLQDARAFTELVEDDPFFDASRELVVTRAPGRLDVMGGIADYSGSLVLQWPLREASLAAVQIDVDPICRVRSLTSASGPAAERLFEIPMGRLFPDGRPLSYEEARSLFAAITETRWAAYVLGALIVLARERAAIFSHGFRIWVHSDVPEGKGVSSSAALEVSVMLALSAALGLNLNPRDLALLCQMVENRVVGAACGVMDQMTASCGAEGKLLSLLCQPAELQDAVTVPPELEFFGLDSGVRHSVSGSDYTSVRVAAFMGARILREETGLDDGGYLVNVEPSEFQNVARRILPESMGGKDFITRYGQTSDTVVQPEAGRDYVVRSATAHPVHEHFRVRTFASLMAGPVTEATCALLGELMYQSHASYTACGLGSDATEALVGLVRAAEPEQGLLGAKITGGGSGGTVAVLARKGARIDPIAEAFADRFGYRPRIFTGSSPGAAVFGRVRLGPVVAP